MSIQSWPRAPFQFIRFASFRPPSNPPPLFLALSDSFHQVLAIAGNDLKRRTPNGARVWHLTLRISDIRNAVVNLLRVTRRALTRGCTYYVGNVTMHACMKVGT